jgi:heme/copper-type cytochrome/quinol oxidase subunit 2
MISLPLAARCDMTPFEIFWVVVGAIIVLLIAIFAVRFYPELVRKMNIHRM